MGREKIGDDGYYNELDDVWETDENNVYAVGGVTINDTTYGVLHWDGNEWSTVVKRGGNHAIFGFSENDIWVAGGAVFHYDGIKWAQIDSKLVGNQVIPLDQVLFDNTEYTCIRGTSSNNLYLRNLWGRIVHWDGSKASLMDVQASEAFRDIYGIDENTIYAVADTVVGYRHGELYSLENKKWILIKKSSLFPSEGELIGPFNSVWLENNYELYTVGDRVAIRRNKQWEEINLQFYIERIRGYASNNIFVTGDFGHFNGKEWYHYDELERASGVLKGIMVYNKTVFIVGYTDQQSFGLKGLILRGTLN